MSAQMASQSGDVPDASQALPQQTYGIIDGDSYISPHGIYRMKIPVLPQLGGDVSDSPNVVTFADDFSTRITVAAFPLTPELKADFEKRGAKDFLVSFFTKFIMPDLIARAPKAQIEQNASFLPKCQGGSMLIFTLLPGGSYFDQRVMIFNRPGSAVAKRGNLCFVKNDFVFFISSELAERVLEKSTYKKTPEEENAILRQRLQNLATTMQFSETLPPAKH
jgi:hypothetical protein